MFLFHPPVSIEINKQLNHLTLHFAIQSISITEASITLINGTLSNYMFNTPYRFAPYTLKDLQFFTLFNQILSQWLFNDLNEKKSIYLTMKVFSLLYMLEKNDVF